jgi:hypothetical protein
MSQPEIDRLTSTSDDAQRKAAISACIAREVRAGKDQDEAAAMCHSMAKEQMGGSNA